MIKCQNETGTGKMLIYYDVVTNVKYLANIVSKKWFTFCHLIYGISEQRITPEFPIQCMMTLNWKDRLAAAETLERLLRY